MEIIAAIWLGILTSISPCPFITNITAVSFLGQKASNPFYVLLSGISYILGRAFLYIVLGMFLALGVGSLPKIAYFFQSDIYYVFAPILILIGLILLDIIKIKLSLSFFKDKDSTSSWLTKGGIFSSFIIGILFAAAFCPVSAALYFGNLIQSKASFISLLAYGLGTGLPVMIFAVIIAFSAHNLAKIYKVFENFEKYARKITGILFIIAGIYSFYKYVF